MRKLSLISLLFITIYGCQTTIYRTKFPIPGKNIYVESFDCLDPKVGKIIADSMRFELLKANYHHASQENADMFLSGVATFTAEASSSISGFSNPNSGFLYGAGSAAIFINSVTFELKNGNQEIIAAGSYDVLGDIYKKSPTAIGKMLGQELLLRLR